MASPNEALLLICHGSARYPNAAKALYRHAESLRTRGYFGQVEVSMLNGSPPVDEVIAAIRKPTIRVVPIFMEDGYFSRIAVPQAINAALRSVPGTDKGLAPTVISCPPIGVHDAMAGVIEQRALAACADLDIPSRTAAVVIIGHGSASEPGRAFALHRHAARVASTGLFARVEAACLEEAPFVADTLRALRAHPVVAIGFFANEGGHVREDVPALIMAEQTERGHSSPVFFHGPIIDDPMVVPIVLDQAMRGLSGE